MIEISKHKTAEHFDITLKELRQKSEKEQEALILLATIEHFGFSVGEVLFSMSRKFKTDSATLMKEIEVKDQRIKELEDAILSVGVDLETIIA